MEIEDARQLIARILPEKRYRHSLGVSETAEKLAQRYGADWEKAKLTGMLHDVAKYFPEEEQQEMIRRRPDIGDDFLNYSEKLWHAPAGAIYVQEKLGIDDPEVLQPILYHTTGRADMSLMEKIIFVADYIEPGRDFSGVDIVRRAAEENLDQAAFLELQRTISHLLEKQQRVYPKTFEAYNNLAGKGKR